jgi:outer membrane lipoprotein-sorting protein
MKTMQLLLKTTLILSAAILLSFDAQAQDPREIIRNMEDQMRGDASYTEMTMKTVRPRYTRETSMRAWTLGDDYALIYITAPARDEGTAFLKRGNEMWNYVPNIDRTLKMPPSMMSQSWMGSDFTNDDLVRGTNLVDEYTHELEGTETVDGTECWVIIMTPKPETPVVYERVKRWVAKNDYLPVKVENYDEYGELVSTINFREVKTLGGRRFPTIMEMIPHDRDGHKTVITTHKADFNIDVSQGFFSIQNLTNIR